MSQIFSWIWLFSGVLLILLVLLHSPKGDGMGGSILITADHGNAEVMKGAEGEPWTAHTTNKVPLILIEGEKRKIPNMGNEITLRDNAGLADIAPTLLQLLNLPIPKEMTGKSLIKEIELKGYNKVVQHV